MSWSRGSHFWWYRPFKKEQLAHIHFCLIFWLWPTVYAVYVQFTYTFAWVKVNDSLLCGFDINWLILSQIQAFPHESHFMQSPNAVQCFMIISWTIHRGTSHDAGDQKCKLLTFYFFTFGCWLNPFGREMVSATHCCGYWKFYLETNLFCFF